MAATEGNCRSQRKGIELEKFKRRMIRSVARRMKEKKTDEQVWEDMKKEIGSNCKKLWERMRMLTLKKLKRLLEADDRVDLIGPVARMTLTDWLLFDLVIVHEKIDVIDREKLTGDYNSKVLNNLFSLVQRFEIEGRSGENLAEAWTAATVYYNSKGHQCSPMMLQRRWYQIKELTRHKFYKFWYNYRGNQRQLSTAKQDSPDDLQKSIALKYPEIVTHKFLSWEEGIENRLVILPDELGVKMRQKNLMKASDTTAPDVVLVEPHIETIDLGANSDSEEENETPKIYFSKTQPPPLVKIKSEPVDVDEDIENHEVHISPEKGSEFDDEIERLQRVEEIFDEDALQNNVGCSDVVIEPNPEVDSPIEEVSKDTLDNACGFTAVDVNNVTSFSIVDGEIVNVENRKESIVIDDDDELSLSSNASTDKVEQTKTTVVSNYCVPEEKDSHIGETTGSYTNDSIVASPSFIAEISSVASAGVKVENVDDVIERDRTDELGDSEKLNDDVPVELYPVISTISSAGIKVERDLTIHHDSVDNDIAMANDEDNFNQSDEITEALPVITTVSSEGVKLEIDTEPIEDNMQTEDSTTPASESEQYSPVDDAVTDDDNLNKPIESLALENDEEVNASEEFGDIPTDLTFADEGIDFADDGIEYVEEDEDDIITVRDPPSTKFGSTEKNSLKIEEETEENEEEESADEQTAENTTAQKFDLKLLMYPIVYTTKLEYMTVFDDTSQYEQVYDKKSIDKIYALSKPISKQSVNSMSEQSIEQEARNDTNGIINEQIEDNNDIAHISDDDLFRNEIVDELTDSDSESEVIDDSKRVKLTSYMLQKPKNRSYNPVLLCKNPDFNTRLKKLTVGFFMSARNRTLLQSCIPMTIDMSKGFEDKLINGTLYLKPTPTVSTPSVEIQDDVEITSAALVKPSSVQQSLMSIDDTLENELKKRMAERVRAINLPDISQVRRLNQHLLTAEVTPLRLDNEKLHNSNKQEKRKIGPACYIQNIKNDINNLLSQQKAKDISITETYIDPVILEKQPSSPPIVNIDNSISSVQPTQPMVFINSPVPSIPPTTSPPQLGSINTLPSKNTKKVDDPNIATNSGTTKTRKPMRRTKYPTLAWNQRPRTQNLTNQELYQTDALLTIDTLYKMLSALDPCSKVKELIPKTHKKNKKKIGVQCNQSTEKQIEETNDTVIDITDDEVSVKKPIRPKNKGQIRIKDKVYCCWCCYRIDYIQGNVCDTISKRRHKCNPNSCECCCRDLYFAGDLASIMTPSSSELVNKEHHISQTIEHVVQLINQPKLTNNKTMADVSLQIDLDDDTVVEPMSDNSSSNKAVLTQTYDAFLESTPLVSSNDSSAELTPLPSSAIKQPTPKIRVYTGTNSITKTSPTAQSTIRPSVTVTTHNRDKTNTPNAHIRTNIIRYKNVKPSVIQPNLCTCRPNISKVKRGRIEINGKNNCTLHKKQIKENKIVLSKKLITDENQPFFVGKGKILLTNVKMPKKVESPTITASLVVPNESDQVQTVSLPAGVQVVLLPDKTLTYIIQPDVILTPEECAILPQFLVAIQQQINAVGITLPAETAVAKNDEVIEIDKDEFPNKPEISAAPNAEHTLETIEPTVPTVNLGDESIKETIIPKTVEDFEMEIDSLVKEKKTIENEDFEMKIDILAVTKKDTETVSTSDENIEASTASNTKASTENPVSEATSLASESKSNNAEEATNKKSLLSDLMEMSGIMEEDLAPPPIEVATPQEPIILDTQNFVLHLPMPREEVTQTNVVPVPTLTPIIPKTRYTATNKSGNFELTAVTSFAELKYSCDNDGIFFKLDLESGQLTSINVCIQKFPSKVQPTSDRSVIDLTDEPDISITGSTDGESLAANLHSIVTLNEENELSSNKTQITTILQKKQRLMERLSNNLKPVNILQSKKHVARILKRNKSLLKDSQFTFYSKRKLDRIEAKIDLVDSDAPMEEEYLVNSDSSDDEPLIKKVKRKRLEETAGPSTEPDQTVDKQSEETATNEQSLEQQENLDEHEQSHVQEQNNFQDNPGEEKLLTVEEEDKEYSDEEHLDQQEDDYIDQEDEELDDMSQATGLVPPVPTNLVLSGGALNAHNIPLNTTYGPDEDLQDDDCILGV